MANEESSQLKKNLLRIVLPTALITALATGTAPGSSPEPSAGASLNIPHISQIQPALQDGTVYLIVHPSFHLYYNASETVLEVKDEAAAGNLNQAFVQQPHTNPLDRLRKAEIENEMRFLEDAVEDDKLVVLALGPMEDSWNHKGLADYINDITSGSSSICYTLTEAPNDGSLTRWDAEKGMLDESKVRSLNEFLQSAGVKKIVFGGGNVGQCQHNTIQDILETLGPDRYEVKYAADISSIPHEHPEKGLINPDDFLDQDGKRNAKEFFDEYDIVVWHDEKELVFTVENEPYFGSE